MVVTLTLVFISLLLSIASLLANDKSFIYHHDKIAICIGGQTSRLLPEYMLTSLIDANPHHTMHFFFNLQVINISEPKIVYNTDSLLTFQAVKYAYMNNSALTEVLTNYFQTNHSQVVSVNYFDLIGLEEMERRIGYELKLFEVKAMESRKTQSTILNMYLHQERCIAQINEYEKAKHIKFRYVISTREDLYFFKPLNLTKLLGIMEEYHPNSTHYRCKMIMKGCADFGGYNQRMFIYHRDTAQIIMSNRLAFYRQLLSEKKILVNTEEFERDMAMNYKQLACPIFVEDFALTAARPVNEEGIVCFPFWEYFKCLPAGYGRYVGKHRCELYYKKPENTTKRS